MKKRNGMTLIELIISLAILSLILISFLSMFTTGVLTVYRAGNKAEAYAKAQEDLEERIARGEAIETNDLSITFDGVTYDVPGGLVETTQYARDAQSSMEVFVPLVSTISITPKVRIEGSEIPFTITINGDGTSFSSQTNAEVLDRFGSQVLAIDSAEMTIVDPETASFPLDENLLNSGSEYVLRVLTPITDEPTEVSRAKINVPLPEIVATTEESGAHHVYTSNDGTNWLNRSDEVPFPATFTVNDSVFGNNRYVLVGEMGQVLVGQDKEYWTSRVIIGAGNLTGITWNNTLGQFYATDDLGKIYKSSDAVNWNQAYTRTGSKPLHEISSTITGTMLAVGSEGGRIYSSDGTLWVEKSDTIMSDFIGTFGYDDGASAYFLAFGSGGTLYRSVDIDAEIWTQVPLTTTSDLHAIDYRAGQLIIVGAAGTILTSGDNGTSWNESTFGTSDFYDAILMSSGDAWIASHEELISSSDLNTWTVEHTFTGESFSTLTRK